MLKTSSQTWDHCVQQILLPQHVRRSIQNFGHQAHFVHGMVLVLDFLGNIIHENLVQST